MMRHIIAALHD